MNQEKEFLDEISESNLERSNIVITDDVFDPDFLEIYPNSKVIWQNVGDKEHTVTSDDNFFSSQIIRPGETFEHTFNDPGEFGYHCEAHLETSGKIKVNELIENNGVE
ncbi:TPA: hypothetical protein DD449_04955 [Candidatus Berkelbacteria bacterium]|uniref:Blue (Type 1) copper domain protein n=1 Tax=Berkelbacteria bacterium GW2011_GWE1_39_12 TaxID=1618337 RepID=A0A0G4B386_9BACT|nr:MAG: blue (type 1) copper domain protein [Berkelbacteria bacterium GW2011_GWE1_39_12]HBO61002.1 hypothetical protein [Candidatus Berkelbacteria bacterium]